MLKRLCFLALAGALAACERPYVEVSRPVFHVITPDTTEAISSTQVRLRVEATSFRAIDTVRAGGLVLQAVGGGAAYEGTIPLQPGINLIPLVAVDAGGVVGHDTLRLLSLRSGTLSGPALPEPRADHAAVQLNDGRVLVTGGVAAPGGDASNQAFVLRVGAGSFDRLTTHLLQARTGHTATLLPDGKVLIVGGTRRDRSPAPSDLVQTVELFDPSDNSFSDVPVVGAGVRHVQHAAFLDVRGATQTLYLIGGEGDVSYSSPRYGLRSDVRNFTVETNPVRLTALPPGSVDGRGATFEAVEGHSVLPFFELAAAGAPVRAFVAGARLTGARLDPVAFALRLTGTGIREVAAPLPVVPRTHHAAALLGPDYGFIMGGYRSATEVSARAEIFSLRAQRYVLVPQADFLDARLDATATFVGNGRIRVVGGFNAARTAALAGSLLYTATL